MLFCSFSFAAKTMSLVVFSALLCCAPAWSAVGKVIVTKGDTYALDNTNLRRALQRRSDIFEGDTVVTGADSEIHIRFEDNAVLALAENSELRISEYRGPTNTGGENILLELLSGGLRTITGSFSDNDKNAYELRTPNASIGIRGTHYEAALGRSGLVVGVYDGGIRVTNQSGSVELGRDASFSFARVANRTSPIQGLLEPPPELRQPTATPLDTEPETSSGSGSDSNSDAQTALSEDDSELSIDALFTEPDDDIEEETFVVIDTIAETLDTLDLESAIDELNDDIDLDALADLRLTPEQLALLQNNEASVGFVVVNDNNDGYVPAVYEAQFAAINLDGVLNNTVEFELRLATSEGTDIAYLISIDGGFFTTNAADDLAAEIQSQILAQTNSVNGVVMQPEVFVSSDGTSLTFIGLSDDGGQTLEIVFTSNTADDEVIAEALGLCNFDSVSCSLGSYTSTQTSEDQPPDSVFFAYVLTGENGPTFINYDSGSLTVLENGYLTPDVVFTGNDDKTQTEYTALDIDDDGITDVEWGYWEADDANPALVLRNPADLSDNETVVVPFFYVDVVPAKAANLVGVATYSNVVEWYATTTAGDVSQASLNATLNVEFDTGLATGTLTLGADDGSWNWDLSYNAELQGVQLFGDTAFGTFTLQGEEEVAAGQVNGIFVGSGSGNEFLGGFGLNSLESSQNAEGIFLLTD